MLFLLLFCTKFFFKKRILTLRDILNSSMKHFNKTENYTKWLGCSSSSIFTPCCEAVSTSFRANLTLLVADGKSLNRSRRLHPFQRRKRNNHRWSSMMLRTPSQKEFSRITPLSETSWRRCCDGTEADETLLDKTPLEPAPPNLNPNMKKLYSNLCFG
jgi:hypothetical protein